MEQDFKNLIDLQGKIECYITIIICIYLIFILMTLGLLSIIQNMKNKS